MKPGPRLLFAPLASYVGPVLALHAKHRGGPSSPFVERDMLVEHWEPLGAARAVAVVLGDTIAWRRAALRWVTEGLTVMSAERVADVLSCTPWDIWGFEYAQACGFELECA